MNTTIARPHLEPASSLSTAPHEELTTVFELIDTWLRQGHYSGASLQIVRRGKVICEKYWGNHQPDTKEFVASAGKWLAAATILGVVEATDLSLEDTAGRWLPQLTGDLSRATLRQMLAHTSGFPPYQPPGAEPDVYQTLAESAQKILPLKSESAPGTTWNYGGLAMQVAGRLAEIAIGENWEAIFQSRIIGPLRMTGTHFTPVDSKPGHNPMLGGGAQSTLSDYSNFLEMLSSGGIFQGRRILQESSVSAMFADSVGNARVPADNFVNLARGSVHHGIYGLGVWRELVDTKQRAVLLSSPSWAGTYPWIDRRNDLFGIFLAHVNEVPKVKDFNPMLASSALPEIVAQYC
jgi:CubicO group peptidase (beta-lactamase class C family)